MTDARAGDGGIGRFLIALARYFRPYRTVTALLVVCLVVDLLFTTLWPLSFKFLIDDAIVRGDRRVLVITLSALLIGVVVAAAAAVGRDHCYAHLGAHVLRDIRVRVFAHLQRLSLAFYGRSGTGDLMARFSSDLGGVETAISWALATLILNAGAVVVAALLLFTLEWRLAVLTLVGLVLCVTVPRPVARRATAKSYALRTAEGRLANTVQEALAGQAVIKALVLGGRLTEAFRAQATAVARTAVGASFAGYLAERLPTVTILIFEVVVVGSGILMVVGGQMTLGTLVAFHALFVNISGAVGGVANVIPVMAQSAGGLRRIEELLAEPPGVADRPAASPVGRLSDTLAFDGVTFSYDGGRPSLDAVSLTIRAGEHVALVGASGSGKSTVLSLMLRFYDPQRGTVTFDGRPLPAIAQDSLRRQIGIVFQESFLFNLSVAENIRLGRPGASDKEVEEAARAAEMHEVIAALPQGYDTSVGERGARFSGGQRQRIALARALIADPSVLLLDETTSALDPATEAAINATLERVGHGRTVISVTHRLANTTGADRILVFDHGRLAEEGRHEALRRRGGAYARLWAKQTGFTVTGESDRPVVAVDRLRALPILAELEPAMLDELSREFATLRSPAERVIIHEGDPGRAFYVIVRGRVTVTQQDEDGREWQVAILEDGDHFGETALLMELPRTATVRTLIPSIFLTLDRAPFLRALHRAPRLRDSLMRTYLQRQGGLA